MKKLLDRWELYRQNRRRFETNRRNTGKIKATCHDYGLFTLIRIYEEWEIETCLPSHDITEKYHYKWIPAWHQIIWFWK